MNTDFLGRPYIHDLDTYEGVPQELFDSLKRYVTDRIPAGHFLEAVLSNDLFNAIGRADPQSVAALPKLCELIYNRCPSTCFGSPEAVTEWLQG